MTIRAIEPSEAKRSLAVSLRPVADNLRQLASELGASPYRVFMVHTKWSGAKPGRGNESILRVVEILPTPRVRAINSLTGRPTSVGILEAESVSVDRISADRYNEDQLGGRVGGVEIPDDQSFYYEVVEDGRSTPNPLRRRFRAASPAGLSQVGLDFSLRLERSSEDRSRRGIPASDVAVRVGD